MEITSLDEFSQGKELQKLCCFPIKTGAAVCGVPCHLHQNINRVGNVLCHISPFMQTAYHSEFEMSIGMQRDICKIIVMCHKISDFMKRHNYTENADTMGIGGTLALVDGGKKLDKLDKKPRIYLSCKKCAKAFCVEDNRLSMNIITMLGRQPLLIYYSKSAQGG